MASLLLSKPHQHCMGEHGLLAGKIDARKEAKPKLKLRTATFSDFSAIAELQSRYGLDPGTYDDWTRLWQANPLYHRLQRDWEIGWVVQDDAKRIVGYLGNIPLPYEFGGKQFIAASGRGLVVEVEYRSAALLLLGRLIHQPGIDLYLNNTIGSASAGSFAAFECHRVPAGVWDHAAFWITGPRVFCEQFLKTKMAHGAKPVSYPVAAGVFLWDRVARRRWRPGGERVEEVQSFDDRFDVFWEEMKRSNPNVLFAVRTRAMLDWHFRSALMNRKIWIAAATEGGRILAYTVFERKDNPAFGVTRMRLVDFAAIDNTSALFPSLLSWALNKCRSGGIQMLETTGRWLEKGELIDRIAPHRRSLSTWTYFYHANNPELAEPLKDPRAWAPSLYDGDASL